MFSSDIVGSDAFLEMPSTTQALYFHLGMRCDDDGFVNPNVTMRMTGANKNDLDILAAKKFLLPFKNGVVVIKHHRINNNWDARDCRRTLYTEELKTLFIKENRAYTLDEHKGEPVVKTYPKRLPDGNPTGTRRDSAGRIEENRIEENRIEYKGGEIPDWIDKKVWAEWVQHRKEKKKPLTPMSIKKQIKFLEAHKADYQQILEKSIQNGWTGIFAPDEKKGRGKSVSVID